MVAMWLKMNNPMNSALGFLKIEHDTAVINDKLKFGIYANKK